MKSIRPTISAMSGYAPGEQPSNMDEIIKLNTNENPYPPSPQVQKALRDINVEDLIQYPNPHSQTVRQAAAKWLGVDATNIIIGNGSDDILTMITRATLEPGKVAVAMSPTYTLYKTLTTLQGASFVEHDFADNYQISDAFRNASAELKLLPNPNAPTGTLIALDKLRILAKACDAQGSILVIDEAYVDFAPTGSSAIALVHEFDNILITRTLSKSFSLAGLRVGIGIASPALINELDKVRDSYNLDTLSQRLATAALESADWMQENSRKIQATRGKLDAKLKALGFSTIASSSNFILAIPPTTLSARELYTQLKARNILIRFFDGSPIERYIRISIGTDQQCETLLNAITEILQQP